MYTIFCIIFMPIVALAGIKLALDMNKPSQKGCMGRRRRRRRW